VEYSGDPLQDFTLIRFLDRFAYRNPKKAAATAGKSGQDLNEDDENELVQLQPKKLPKRTSYRPWGAKQFSVTSQEYLQTPVDSVPVDERFLHKYRNLCVENAWYL